MILAHWEPHHRDEDGEPLGYLAPAEDGLCVPVTLFGHAPAEPGDADEARAVLDSAGLSYLADRWLLTLPERDEPVTVTTVEAGPARVRVADVDFGCTAASCPGPGIGSGNRGPGPISSEVRR